MYPSELVQPMRDDLGTAGFEHLYTANDVKEALQRGDYFSSGEFGLWMCCC